MHFLEIEKVWYKKYKLVFKGIEKELESFLKIVVYDDSVYYNFITKRWEIDECNLQSFLDNHQDIIISVKYNIPKIKRYDKELDNIGKSMKLKPYLYQREAIKFAIDNINSLIILPCGAGKTPLGIGAYLEAKERNIISGPGLIVVKASLKYQWSKEIGKFSDLRVKIVETPAKARKKFDSQFEDADLYVLNYETLKNVEVINRLKMLNLEYIYMDEIHYVNNHNSDRAKALYQLNDIKMKIGATATPITSNPANVFGIFNMLDKDLFENYTKFSKQYLKFIGRNRPPIPKNTEQLREQIAPYILVKTKEEVASQLPKTIINQRFIQMTNKMAEMNDQIMFELDTESKKSDALEQRIPAHELDNNEEFQQCKAKIMALQTFAQELVDSPRLLIESESNMSKQYYIDEESPKLDVCMELIDEIINSGEKVCIFTKFERMQNILEEEINKKFKKVKVAKINGTMDAAARYVEAYDKFRDTDEYKVLLGTDSMAEGVNLSKCKYLIEYDIANSYAIQTQRWGRLERADSIHDNVFVYQLIVEESWDQIQCKVVSKKQGYDTDIIKSLA